MTAPAPSDSPRDPLSQPAVVRLILCASLFGLWMLYLGLLVLTRTEVPTGPRLLSRPQALVSALDVVAEIDDPESGTVRIQRVLYPLNRADLEGKTLQVPNLSSAGTYRNRQFQRDVQSPGTYLLLLLPPRGERAELAPLPPSPGFSRDQANPRAYSATADLLAQYAHIVKPER